MMANRMVPGTGSNRGDMDRETAQRQELELIADPIDDGPGDFRTPTRSGNFSRRGRLVRLPEFTDPGSSAIHVAQFSRTTANGTAVALAPVTTTVFSYTVPVGFGLRVNKIVSMPIGLGGYSYIETTWAISEETISGYYSLNWCGTPSEMVETKLLVPGGKTIIANVTNAAWNPILILAGINGYLFSDGDSC